MKYRNILSMKKLLIMLMFSFAALALVAAPGMAQECTVNTNTNVTVNSTISNVSQRSIHAANWGSQTFTVEGSGCFMLEKVTFSVLKNGSPPNDLTVQIRNTVDGIPGNVIMAVKTIAKANVPTTFTDLTVTLDIPIEIAGGVQYALVVFTTGGNANNSYRLGLAGLNPYEGGKYCKSENAGLNWNQCFENILDVRMSICVSACPDDEGCVYSQGFWKNHQENWPPVEGLYLGHVNYNSSQLLAILNEPVEGNGLISLAKQLIAAGLNAENGAPVPPGVKDAIIQADSVIGTLEIPPIGDGYLSPDVTEYLKDTLDQYNNGLYVGGPLKCEEDNFDDDDD